MPLLQTVRYDGCEFQLLDLTAIHPSGNKYFKLKENIACAKSEGLDTLLSFGGAWSNHIHALAQTGRDHGFNSIGVIRGERPKQLSAMLADASAMGMKLHFVSRQTYREKETAAFHDDLRARFGDFYLIPEGGSNSLGVSGARDIVELLSGVAFDLVVVPVGTGGTLAGISSALDPDKRVLGISVLKGATGLSRSVAELAPGLKNWQLDHGGHEGGYARVSARLRAFILDFEAKTGIDLEPVYTAKMLQRLIELLKAGEVKNAVAIHTGGLQGRRGFSF